MVIYEQCCMIRHSESENKINDDQKMIIYGLQRSKMHS
jgi:hypothetical protein